MIKPSILYMNEVWTLYESINKIDATEMRLLKKIEIKTRRRKKRKKTIRRQLRIAAIRD